MVCQAPTGSVLANTCNLIRRSVVLPFVIKIFVPLTIIIRTEHSRGRYTMYGPLFDKVEGIKNIMAQLH